MKRIIFLLIFLSTSYAAFIKNAQIIEDSKNRLRFLIKGSFSSYNALMLPSPLRLIVFLKDLQLTSEYPKTIESKGDVVSKIHIEKKGKSVAVIFYSKRKGGFRYKIETHGEYLIVTCWSKKNFHISRTGYMSLPLPKKEPLSKGTENTIPKYTGKRISLDFYKADLHNVFRLFSEISGKNIIVSDKVKGTLTMSLKDVPWDFALDLILEIKNLKKEERLNTYIITPIEKKEKGEGELIVRRVSKKVLQLTKELRRREEERRKAESIILKAYNLEKKGKKQEALRLYEKAISLWEDNIELLKKTAYLYYSIGNYARSYYFANKALKINPEDPEAALYGALSAIRLEKKEDAYVFFDIAIKGEPKIPEAYYDYALFLERQKDYIHSLMLYEQYEELFGPLPDTSLAIARIYEILGNKDKACKRYRELLLSGFKLKRSTEKMIKDKIKRLCKMEKKK